MQNRGVIHCLEISGNLYKKSEISTPKPEIPLENEKSRTLNVEVIHPSEGKGLVESGEDFSFSLDELGVGHDSFFLACIKYSSSKLYFYFDLSDSFILLFIYLIEYTRTQFLMIYHLLLLHPPTSR